MNNIAANIIKQRLQRDEIQSFYALEWSLSLSEEMLSITADTLDNDATRLLEKLNEQGIVTKYEPYRPMIFDVEENIIVDATNKKVIAFFEALVKAEVAEYNPFENDLGYTFEQEEAVDINLTKLHQYPDLLGQLEALVTDGYITRPDQQQVEEVTYEPVSYRISPSDTYESPRNDLYNAALPAAIKRLEDALTPLTTLPWNPRPTNNSDMVLEASGLNEEQMAIIKAAPSGAVKPVDRIGSRIQDDKEPYEYVIAKKAGGGYSGIDNRAHAMVMEAYMSELQLDATRLSGLPWQLRENGELYVSTEDINNIATPHAVRALPDNDAAISIEALLEKRGIIADENGIYTLLPANTVRKTYDGSDGETDPARQDIYDHIHQAVLERYQPITELPWRYNEQTQSFTVSVDDVPEQQQTLMENILAKQGNYFEMQDLASYSMRAGAARGDMEAFRTKLAETVPDDFPIVDLAELPWQYEYPDLLMIPADTFKASAFFQQIQNPTMKSATEELVPLQQTPNMMGAYQESDGIITIDPKDIAALPLHTAIKRGLEARYDLFVDEHKLEIQSLPWSFRYHDELRHNTAQLFAVDLGIEQKELVSQLIKMNQLKASGECYYACSDLMRDALSEQFQAWQPTARSWIAELHWEYHEPSISLNLDVNALSNEQLQGMERMGFRPTSFGTFNIPPNYDSQKDYPNQHQSRNTLREEIAEKLAMQRQNIVLPDDIAALPWYYRGDDIVINASDLTDAQRETLKQAVPDINHKKAYAQTDTEYYALAGRYPDDIGNAVIPILQREVYNQVIPIAEQALEAQLERIAELPWQKNGTNHYQLNSRNLTQEQQSLLADLPYYFRDDEAIENQRDRFSKASVCVLDHNAADTRLIDRIASNQKETIVRR